ncbi:MAG: hypothetical protein ACI8QZ_002326 [Chlamydiales bacterium]|jgi:hypothetical protein
MNLSGLQLSAITFSSLLFSSAVPAAAGPLDACVTSRQSLDTSGGDSDGFSRKPGLSADGEWVAFESGSTDLVSGDTNGFKDIFVREMGTGVTELVSVTPGAIQGNGDSYHTSISANGRFVIFESDATNLVVGDTNGVRDVFVADLQLGTLVRVSVDNDGQEGGGPIGPTGGTRHYQGWYRDGLQPDQRSDDTVGAVRAEDMCRRGESGSLRPALHVSRARPGRARAEPDRGRPLRRAGSA